MLFFNGDKPEVIVQTDHNHQYNQTQQTECFQIQPRLSTPAKFFFDGRPANLRKNLYHLRHPLSQLIGLLPRVVKRE